MTKNDDLFKGKIAKDNIGVSNKENIRVIEFPDKQVNSGKLSPKRGKGPRRNRINKGERRKENMLYKRKAESGNTSRLSNKSSIGRNERNSMIRSGGAPPLGYYQKSIKIHTKGNYQLNFQLPIPTIPTNVPTPTSHQSNNRDKNPNIVLISDSTKTSTHKGNISPKNPLNSSHIYKRRVEGNISTSAINTSSSASSILKDNQRSKLQKTWVEKQEYFQSIKQSKLKVIYIYIYIMHRNWNSRIYMIN